MEPSFLQGLVWIMWPAVLVLLWFMWPEVKAMFTREEEPEDWTEGWDRIVNPTRPYDWEQDGS